MTVEKGEGTTLVFAEAGRGNLHDIDFLLTLTKAFRDRVQDDNSVCDKIKYVWYDRPIIFSQAEKDKLITEMGEELARLFLDSLEM